jgi:hypothetical protein
MRQPVRADGRGWSRMPVVKRGGCVQPPGSQVRADVSPSERMVGGQRDRAPPSAAWSDTGRLVSVLGIGERHHSGREGPTADGRHHSDFGR